MTFLFEGVDVNFQPQVSNKLVYCGMPWNGFHICPLIVIRNNRNSDVTLKSVKFETIPAGVSTSVNTDFVVPSQTTGFYDKFRSDITKLREHYDIERVKFTFTIEVHTMGTSTNSITIDVTAAKGLSFFGKKDDLGPGLFWVPGWRAHHGGDQALAYDCKVARMSSTFVGDPNVGDPDDPRNYRYTVHYLKLGGSPEKNEDDLSWEMPVYSMTDGKIDTVRNEENDIKPKAFYDNHLEVSNEYEQNKIKKAPANLVAVETSDNLRIIYAHFKKGSIPYEIKPGASVTKGQKLGLVGNSGQTTGPHLHIHAKINEGPAMRVKVVASKHGIVPPFSVREKYFHTAKPGSKLSILLSDHGTDSPLGHTVSNTEYFWPFPITFTDCVFQLIKGDEGPYEWTKLEVSGPQFCTLDDSDPVAQSFGAILTTIVQQVCQWIIYPGNEPLYPYPWSE